MFFGKASSTWSRLLILYFFCWDHPLQRERYFRATSWRCPHLEARLRMTTVPLLCDEYRTDRSRRAYRPPCLRRFTSFQCSTSLCCRYGVLSTSRLASSAATTTMDCARLICFIWCCFHTWFPPCFLQTTDASFLFPLAPSVAFHAALKQQRHTAFRFWLVVSS